MVNILVSSGVVAAGLISDDPQSADSFFVSQDEKKAEQAAKPTPQDDTTTK